MSMTETALAPKRNYTLAITALNGTTAKQNLGSVVTTRKAGGSNIGRIASIRLVATVDMFITYKMGSAPTADVAGMFIPAYSPEYLNVPENVASTGDCYLTGIVTSGTGTLYASVME